MRLHRTFPLLLAVLAVAAAGCARAGAGLSSASGQPALSPGARLVSSGGGQELILSFDSLYRAQAAGLVPVARPLPQAESGIVGIAFAGRQGVLATSDGTSVTLLGSSNAGHTWREVTRRSLARVLLESVSDLDVALTGRRVVVLAREATSSNFASAAVLASPDGTTWSVGRAPTAGRLAVAGGLVWLVGGPMGDQVHRSADGVGWTAVTLPVKASSWTAGRPAAAGGGVVVPVTVHETDGSSRVVLYLTADQGRTWSAAASIRVPATTESGTSLPVAIAPDGHWFVLQVDGSRVYHGTLSGSASVGVTRSNGLPTGVQEAAFTSSTQGFVLVSTFSCPNGKASCRPSELALRTADGGENWERVGGA